MNWKSLTPYLENHINKCTWWARGGGSIILLTMFYQIRLASKYKISMCVDLRTDHYPLISKFVMFIRWTREKPIKTNEETFMISPARREFKIV